MVSRVSGRLVAALLLLGGCRSGEGLTTPAGGLAGSEKSGALPPTMNSAFVLDSVPATVADTVSLNLTQGAYDSA